MLATFFTAGTLATSWKMRTKQQTGLAEQHRGQRTAAQVIANGGVAAILSLLSFLLFTHQQSLLLLMVACSLSSATADTLSSELGNVYGKKFYNIVNFKKDIRGLNGVVSFEGTMIGIAGSSLIALIYTAQAGFTIHFLWIVIAGTIGNLTDSVLGATLERKKILNNDGVNFLNTLTAALVGLLLFCFLMLLYIPCAKRFLNFYTIALCFPFYSIIMLRQRVTHYQDLDYSILYTVL
jgi:uncharacterized protein (TIGR00297 family)